MLLRSIIHVKRQQRRANAGVAAVELALVGPLFFLLLLSVFDISIMAFRESSLRAAAESGARVLRTGEVSSALNPETAFVTAVCETATGINCGDIIYDVRPYADFDSVSFEPLARNSDGVPTNTQFTSGTAEGVMAVRLLTRHQFVTPYLERAFSSHPQDLYLESTIIVRGEPWE